MFDSIKRIFNSFNSKFFNSNLILPDIVIDANKKYGLRWEYDKNTFVIGSSFVTYESDDIIASVLHEMVHIYNHNQKISDVNENQYHNMHFVKVALRCGLAVGKDKNQGWSFTSLNPRASASYKEHRFDLLSNQILRDIAVELSVQNHIIEANRNSITVAISNLTPSKVFFLKYECACPAPYNSIRSGRRPDGHNAPDIICDRCKLKFKCVSPLD